MAGNDKQKREGRLKRFIRETTGELRRVAWPTGPEARRMTLIVIVVLIVMAIFLGIVDIGARELLALVVPG